MNCARPLRDVGNADTGLVHFINRRLLDRLGQGPDIDKLSNVVMLIQIRFALKQQKCQAPCLA